MNPNNTCTLEASQRLAAAGIVLETEFYWHITKDKPSERIYVAFVGHLTCSDGCRLIPAPSMSELLRELPKYNDCGCPLCLMWDEDNRQWVAGYWPRWEDTFNFCKGSQNDENPYDALADLLIWVRGRE